MSRQSLPKDNGAENSKKSYRKNKSVQSAFHFRRYIARISSRAIGLLIRSYGNRLSTDILWKRPGISLGIGFFVALGVAALIWALNPWFMAFFKPERRLAISIGSALLVWTALGFYQILAWQTLPIFLRHERELVKKKEQELYHLAQFDSLTGLHNRPAFERHLQAALARAKRHDTSLAVGIIDLDDFKPVNDVCGHNAGDVLLKQIAQRLQSHVRDSDFIARLGGDEFIVLIEDLNPSQSVAQLTHILERLHQAVEDPFAVAPSKQVQVGMTMGVALFPFDAENPDGLIRQADSAMYQAKARKIDRTQWWQLGTRGSDVPRADANFSPYGENAAEVLDRYATIFESVADHFVENFYERMTTGHTAKSILANLHKVELDKLRAGQILHFRFLLGSKTTLSMLRARALQLGEIHALVGVNASLLVESESLYRCLLSETINRTLLSTRDRYLLLHIADSRLHDDMRTQLDAMDETKAKYFACVGRPFPTAGLPWVDTAQTALAWLAALPGILMCCIVRPDSSGIFQLEASAGEAANAIHGLVDSAGAQPRLGSDQSCGYGHGLVATAWIEGTIQNTADYTSDARTKPWHDIVRAVGARTLVAIPLYDRDFAVEAVLIVYGAYPGQFNFDWMKEFCLSLQRFWEGMCHRYHSNASCPATPQNMNREYRRLVFNGGVTIFVQPTIELWTGRIFRVEALARLQQPDGAVVPPSVFLPLLGKADLDLLFRLTMDLSLRALTEWEAQGLHTDVSVNLAPSSLLNPDCNEWIVQALRKYAVAPERVTLEILESPSLLDNRAEEVLTSLSRIGVQLALDDLGSGYSSLKRLAEWPVDIIKIDQGLISRIHERPLRVLGLLQALIQIGRDLDRKIVVEGLEKLDMAEASALLGAHYGQGYGFARPMPVSAFPAWARSFSLSMEKGRIRTALGALAYHWRFMHRDDFDHPVDVEDCPLTTFLVGVSGVDVADARRWHAQVHAKGSLKDNERRQASEALITWLIERVCEVAPTPRAGTRSRRG